MVLLSSILLFLILLSIVLLFIGWLFASMMLEDREKISPFECGFDPGTSVRGSFSLKFFMIGIIFLIFDVEIVLLLPFPLIYNFIYDLYGVFFFLFFMFVLFFGLIYEWEGGALDWVL